MSQNLKMVGKLKGQVVYEGNCLIFCLLTASVRLFIKYEKTHCQIKQRFYTVNWIQVEGLFYCALYKRIITVNGGLFTYVVTAKSETIWSQS